VISKCLFIRLPEDRDLLNPNEKSVFTVSFFRFPAAVSWKRPEEEKYAITSLHAQPRLAWPLSDKTQMRSTQDIVDDLSILLRMYYCCKILCVVTILS